MWHASGLFVQGERNLRVSIGEFASSAVGVAIYRGVDAVNYFLPSSDASYADLRIE
jgi:hypothetical protein